MANTWTYAYTGAVQSWTAPSNGIYKVDLYGAQGGNSLGVTGCYGSHLRQYIRATAGTTYYICVGGKGEDLNTGMAGYYVNGGYNGGSSGTAKSTGSGNTPVGGAGGGGATSISTVNGTLSVQAANTIIGVAGGGGGAHSFGLNGSVTYSNGNGTVAGETLGNSVTSGNDTLGHVGAGGGYFDGAPATISENTLIANRGQSRAVTVPPSGYTNLIEYEFRAGNGYAQIEKIGTSFNVALGSTEINAISLGSVDISGLSIGGI